MLTWAFVGLRVCHSLVHLTYNRVLHRLVLFACSNLVLRDALGSPTARDSLNDVRERVTAMLSEDRPLTYVALGDSTGLGVGAWDGRGYVSRTFERLRARSPRWSLVNLSASGANVRHVAAHQLRPALRARPELATLFVGGNDVWQGTPRRAFEADFDRLTSSLSQTARYLIVGTIPNLAHAPAAVFAESWLGTTRERLEAVAVELNSAIREIAQRHRVQLVDLFAIGLADRPHYFCGDGFHPSGEGYEAWSAQLFERILDAQRANDPA